MPLLFCMTLLAAAPEFTALGVDGSETRGELRAFSADRVVLASSGGDRTLAASQIVRLAPSVPSTSAPGVATAHLRIVDGTTLAATTFAAAKGRVAASLGDDADVSIPIDAVHWVRLKEQTPEIAAQWEQVLKTEPAADLIVIREENAVDFLEGVIGDVTAETVEFTLDGEKVPVKRTKVEGLVYFHPKAASPSGASCIVTDRNGSTIGVETASLTENRLKLRTPAGVELSLPLDRIATIQFPATYLSQLKSPVWTFTPHTKPAASLAPLVEKFYRPRFDESLESGPLRLGGREYRVGIAMHSRTELTYLLPEPFSKFTAVAGIDDRVRPDGDVRLVVRGDDKVLLDRVLTGADAPLPIALDVTGVTRLHILVDFGDDGAETSDHLDLCDARLFK